jgi:hypothetical protein
MIKMNFNNPHEDEDRQIIVLVKKHIMESPSDRLAENTMTRYLSLRAEKKFSYKPCKIPLYIMAAIAFLLVLPFLVPVTNRSSLDTLSELLSYSVSPVIKYLVWLWLGLVTVCISILLFPMQFRFRLNAFKS